jgi:hypothetical protein
MKFHFANYLRSLSLFLLISAFSLSSAWAETTVLEADGQLQWRRGNMHTHSHWSDGDDYLEMIALWYRNHGYQFLVFTDHNVLPNTERWIDVEKSRGGQLAFDKLKERFPEYVQQRTTEAGALEVRLSTFQEVAARLNQPGEYLLIQGEEISDSFAETVPIHMGVSNIQHLILPMRGTSVQETIENNFRAAMEQREQSGEPMIVHLCHPNFHYGITAEDMMLVRGERFFEVYNGHPSVNNAGDAQHASTDRIWDILLTRRLAEFNLPSLFAFAVDDGHQYHKFSHSHSNPGRGWVMVLTDTLSTRAIVDALEAGRFYASNGVTLRSITTSSSHMAIEVEPVEGETYTTEFIGTRQGYDPNSRPAIDADGNEICTTRCYSDDIGEVLATVEGTKARYEFAGDEIYVRARVTSSAEPDNSNGEDGKKTAWVQPVTLVGRQ